MLRKQVKQYAGAVTVEFALTAPILFLLFFGAIEFSRANMLLHTSTIAATEGARVGIISGATTSDVEAAVNNELRMVGIANARVLVEPATITPDTKVVTVGVSVPVDASNGYLIPRFFLGKNVIKIVSMTREAKRSDTNATQTQAQRAVVLASLTEDTDGN